AKRGRTRSADLLDHLRQRRRFAAQGARVAQLRPRVRRPAGSGEGLPPGAGVQLMRWQVAGRRSQRPSPATRDLQPATRSNDLIAGVVATAALAAGVVLHLPVIAAIAVGGAVYGGVRLMLPNVRNKSREQLATLQQLAATTKNESMR